MAHFHCSVGQSSLTWNPFKGSFKHKDKAAKARHAPNVANPPGRTAVKIPKIRKRRVLSGSKHTVPNRPRKGWFGSKNPHFYTGQHRENWDFLSRSPLS